MFNNLALDNKTDCNLLKIYNVNSSRFLMEKNFQFNFMILLKKNLNIPWIIIIFYAELCFDN